MLYVLLALRFLVELALFASFGVIGAQLSSTTLLRWALALGLVAVSTVVWGVFLSPRRRVDLPLAARTGIELVLFAIAATGLVWSGHATWAWVLLVSEVVVLVALWSVGFPPGADAAAPGRRDPRP